MCLGENIRYLRIKNGYSQDYIADKLGYKSFTTIQKWESGASEPPIKKLKELSILFNVDMDDMSNKNLKYMEENKEGDYYLNDETRQIAQEIFENPDMRSLFDMSRKMTPDRLKAHLEFMKKLYDENNR